MERESIFLVILIFLLISLTIYEAFRDNRGSMVLGRHGGFQGVLGDKTDMIGGDEKTTMNTSTPTSTPAPARLDGTCLPPIIEYKSALSHAIYNHLSAIARVARHSEKASLLAATKGFNKFFDKAFSRFMFTANSRGTLNGIMVPTSDPIDYEDLSYYLRSHGCTTVIKAVRSVPDASNFRSPCKSVAGAKYEHLSEGLSEGRSEGLSINHHKGPLITNPGTPPYPLEIPQYNRLRELYTGPEGRFDAMAYTLVYVYNSLGGLGNNGSVPIGLLNDDDGNDNGVIELFGSPLNTQSRKGYCSPFAVEKEFFGSLGSFYDYVLEEGNLYTCNPPYIDGMMEEAAIRVVNRLKEIQKNPSSTDGPSTDVFFVFPVWDKAGLALIGDPKKEDDPNADERYGCLEVLRASGLVRAEKILHKDAHKYYSWYGDRLVAYSHTYVFVLSTSEQPRIILDDYLSRWDALIAKKEQTGSFGSRLE